MLYKVSTKGKIMIPSIIAIEGIDGTGKTGIVNALRERFEEYQCLFTREPSDTGYRDLIKGSINCGDEILLALLFAADHRHHIENTVKPALASGLSIITDRYLHSHLAYQTTTLTGELQFPDKWLGNIYSREWILPPDLVIHLTARPETCEARIRASRAQIDNYEKAAFLAKIEANYQKFYNQPTYRCRVITISTENKNLSQTSKEAIAAVENNVSWF